MEFKTSSAPVDYKDAVAFMESRVKDIHEHGAEDLVWLLEHPPIYTAGTSAKAHDLLDERFPTYKTGRGGQYTYHGPGQRIAYVMMNLRTRQKTPDIKAYVFSLEQVVIDTLAHFDIAGERRAGRVGIWVDMARYGRVGEAKIAAIGVRVRHWVTFHGLSVNVNPDLSHFNSIVPCGISDAGVTSFHDLGVEVTIKEFDKVIISRFRSAFC